MELNIATKKERKKKYRGKIKKELKIVKYKMSIIRKKRFYRKEDTNTIYNLI